MDIDEAPRRLAVAKLFDQYEGTGFFDHVAKSPVRIRPEDRHHWRQSFIQKNFKEGLISLPGIFDQGIIPEHLDKNSGSVAVAGEYDVAGWQASCSDGLTRRFGNRASAGI